MVRNHRPKDPDGGLAKGPDAFNAHSPGGGGSGLVQPVFRSPARIPPAESRRRGSCAAPPSEKRYTLSRLSCIGNWGFFRPDLQPIYRLALLDHAIVRLRQGA
jgi:hypothetical protein